jgi:hypothetical protein
MRGMRRAVGLLMRHMDTEFGMEGIRSLGLFPWTRNDRTITRLIRRDREAENVLGARIEGTGRRTRYFVRGDRIIRYLERYGSLLMGARER